MFLSPTGGRGEERRGEERRGERDGGKGGKGGDLVNGDARGLVT